ncbi:centromere protein V [Cocos nucifera]|uniref:Centromere protein V n=1 Tax=Cocos nucifera TaxID=13894 RepID=A0A8K0I2Y9_COCNU|nr:centromere protein V [Cocos nucifera]
MSVETVIHNGGCHCKRVRWQAEAPPSVVGCTCNCSNCSMRGTTHFVVPNDKFKLMEESEQFLTTYTFGTHSAKHIFCKVCGITSFYKQRGNPDGVAIVINCVDPGTLKHYEIRHFDGKRLLKI